MANFSTWSRSVPSGASLQREFDDLYRSDKSIIEEALNSEHYFVSSSATSAGVHRLGSARIYMGTRSQVSSPSDGYGRLMYASDTSSLHVLGASSATTLFAGLPLAQSGGTVYGVISFRSSSFPSINNPGNENATLNLSWATNVPRIRIGGSGSGSAADFEIQGTNDVKRFGVDASGNGEFTGSVLTVGSGKVWTSANDGAGSGLDADTIDGLNILTGSLAVSAFTLPASTATNIYITVTGAARGNPVVFGYYRNVGVKHEAMVVSDNSVRVAFEETAGIDIGFSAQTFTAVVFKPS